MTKRRFSCEFFGETNQGLVRTNNEDTYICQQIWDDTHILCAAIDGLGGYEGGEIAAELARKTIIKHLEDFASKKTGDLLKAALIDANNEIICQHKARPKVSRMGCVASVGIIDLSQGIISIAHVGDSRIYQFGNGELKKLTHDHSLVGYREETGELSEEDAMSHPRRNVIDKYLGEQHLNYDTESYIEISAWPIIGDMQYLFCSDGLTDLVTGVQISEILSSELSIEYKVKSLISSANKAGGKDNITVVLSDVSSISSETIDEETNCHEQENAPSQGKTRKTWYFTLIAFCILSFAIGATSMFIWLKSNEMRYNKDIELQTQLKDLQNRNYILEDSIAKLSAIKISGTEDIDVDSVTISSKDSVNVIKSEL